MLSIPILEAIRSVLTIPVMIGVVCLGWYMYRRERPSRWIGYRNVITPKPRYRADALIGSGIFVAIYALLMAVFTGPNLSRAVPSDQQEFYRNIFIAVVGSIFAIGIGEIMVGCTLLWRRKRQPPTL
jgi:uncharacterized iron-regulated membrane protein